MVKDEREIYKDSCVQISLPDFKQVVELLDFDLINICVYLQNKWLLAALFKALCCGLSCEVC